VEKYSIIGNDDTQYLINDDESTRVSDLILSFRSSFTNLLPDAFFKGYLIPLHLFPYQNFRPRNDFFISLIT